MHSSGDERRRAYFKANIKVIAVLLVIWAFVSFGCGILLAPWLNQFNLPGTGYKLGFWFAQQGSIIVFIILILVYAILLTRLDDEYAGQLEDDPGGAGE